MVAGWSLFAFGGAYTWTIVPLAAGAVALAVVTRPPILSRGTRALDAALVASLLVAGFQLIPLPAPARLAIAPALGRIDREIYLDARDPSERPSAPLTVDAAGTIEAMVLAVSGLLIFWSARAVFADGTPRRTIRAIAAYGLIASGLAIVQHATAPSLLYWVWRPISRNASPYTPFVNKNDLAAWLILAIPLAAGYLLARIDLRRREGLASPLEAILDDTTAWLAGGVIAMTAALLVSLSRAGLTGAAASIVVFLALARPRMTRRGQIALVGGIVLAGIIGLFYVSSGAIAVRIQETIATGAAGRREIWEVTRAMIRDFPVLGVGVGAYARAMTVYQPPHVFSFNHAHSEYLQIATEGGIVLCLTVGAAVAAGTAGIVERLRSDRTPVFWIRAGAASAVAAIAVQSIWETGLRMPANSVVFAICCAAALHGVDSSAAEPGRGASRDPIRVRER